MPLEFDAPGMLPQGEHPLTVIITENYDTLVEVEMMVTIMDAAKKKKKREILEIEELKE